MSEQPILIYHMNLTNQNTLKCASTHTHNNLFLFYYTSMDYYVLWNKIKCKLLLQF
jgi:hypothetical protein